MKHDCYHSCKFRNKISLTINTCNSLWFFFKGTVLLLKILNFYFVTCKYLQRTVHMHNYLHFLFNQVLLLSWSNVFPLDVIFKEDSMH